MWISLFKKHICFTRAFHLILVRNIAHIFDLHHPLRYLNPHIKSWSKTHTNIYTWNTHTIIMQSNANLSLNAHTRIFKSLLHTLYLSQYQYTHVSVSCLFSIKIKNIVVKLFLSLKTHTT